AITLFLRRAKKQGLRISKEEHFAQLQDVINRTACIPLAIEWIIGRMGLKNETLEDALAQFHVADNEILKYCFENLIKVVGSGPKKVLLAVSLFAESVSWETLKKVTNIPSLEAALNRLVKASLIEEFPFGINLKEWRYSVLAPTRLCANSLRQD